MTKVMIWKVKSDNTEMKYIRIHIKKVLVVTGIAMLASGCADHSYPGEEVLSSTIGNTPVHGTFPILPSIGSSQLGEDVAARNTGSGMKKELWDTVYIYSYKKDLTTDYTFNSSTDKDVCLVDGLMQDEQSQHGKKSLLADDEPYLTWTNEPKTVYFHDNNQPYDLFAYYLDGAYTPDANITKSSGGISMEITINGYNDIMSAKAAVTEEQLSSGNFSEKDKQSIIDMSFSNITAAWNIQPVFRFKHHMSRFVFYLYPAREDVGNVFIESISVKSKTRGVFTVASSAVGNMGVDFSQEQEKVEFKLREADNSPLVKDRYHPITEGVDFSKPLYQRPYTQVGDALLLPPGETEYVFDIVFKQEKNGMVIYNPSSMTLTNSAGPYEPGNQYNVKLAVYGVMEIIPEVTVTPWVFGGSITIDPDEDF